MNYEEMRQLQNKKREKKTEEEKRQITMKMKRDIREAFDTGKMKILGKNRMYYEV